MEVMAPGSGERMGWGVVRWREPVTGKISRKAGNGERSRQGANTARTTLQTS
jgi:hypothetical protein